MSLHYRVKWLFDGPEFCCTVYCSRTYCYRWCDRGAYADVQTGTRRDGERSGDRQTDRQADWEM